MRALALAVLALVPVAAAAQAPVIDSVSIGSYRLEQSRARAIDVFGPPTESADVHPFNLPQSGSRVCRTVWRSLELMVEYSGECSLPGRARRVTVRGRVWRTREGLRVGDPTRRIAQVYRGARLAARSNEYPSLGVEWDLQRARPTSSVIVATREGRIVGFELRRR